MRKGFSQKRFKSSSQHNFQVLGMVSFKLCDKCRDYGFTKVLHFQMWKTMEQLYQTLQTKEIMHDNAKESLYDMFLIF
jgi:hypothetical protein